MRWKRNHKSNQQVCSNQIPFSYFQINSIHSTNQITTFLFVSKMFDSLNIWLTSDLNTILLYIPQWSMSLILEDPWVNPAHAVVSVVDIKPRWFCQSQLVLGIHCVLALKSQTLFCNVENIAMTWPSFKRAVCYENILPWRVLFL